MEAVVLRKKVVAWVAGEEEVQEKMLAGAAEEVVALHQQAVVARVSMRLGGEEAVLVVQRLRLTLVHEVVAVEAFPLLLHSKPDKKSLLEAVAEDLQNGLVVVAVPKECAGPRREAGH